MRKPVYATLLLGVLLMTGCSGTTKGRDTLEPCNAITNGDITVYPGIEANTQVCENLDILLKHAVVGEYKEAFDMLIIDDTTFINTDNFASWFQNSGITASYALKEDMRDKTKIVNVSTETANYDFYPEKQEDGSWKYKVNELCATDFKITVPEGIPATLDGINLDKYKTGTDNNLVTYTIPQITDAPHKLVIDTEFTEPININIQDCSAPVDATKYLAVPKSLRSTLIKDLASPTLAEVTKTVASQDWDAFCAFFTPDKNMQSYQQHFYKGKVKGDIYNLTLLETRDLERSDLDVSFTGFNTISVKFGTKWSWSAKDDVKLDDAGNVISVNENRIKQMRVVNTLEFYYDKTSNKYYLNNMDTDSITLLAPGEEQWR